MSIVSADIPEKLEFLNYPSRYKVAYGGRGGAKSWAFANTLLIKGVQSKLRILCAREIQKSIRESVHRLLTDSIERLGLSGFYSINDKTITGLNGTAFIFEGLFRNVNRIKSIEGIDICWIEEAENVSEESWDYLVPTIRKENSESSSEIWISFNPKNEDDPTYQRFVVHQPPDCKSVEINYYDNPWFPKVLNSELEFDKATDKQKYNHIWLGKPVGAGGKIWGAFNQDVHIKEFPWDMVRDRANCYMAMDPHSHYYPFCTWIAVFPKNDRMRWPEDFDKWIYNEWPTVNDLNGEYHKLRKSVQYNGSLKNIAQQVYIKDGTAEHGIEIRQRYIDTRYAKGSGSWSWSSSTTGIVDMFSKAENGSLIFTLPPERIIDAQRHKIHSDMLYNTNMPVTQYNEPSFYVAPWCHNTIISLKNHRTVEGSEKEDDKYKEASDTIRLNYAGIDGCKYRDPNKKNRERQPIGAKPGGWMG